MFIEPHLTSEKRGWIEVICGSMFSGKTEELIRRLKRAKIANLKVEIFKPAFDTRYHEQKIVSHDENAIQSTPIESSTSILLMAGEVDVIGIDEAQFFDDQLPEVCDQLALRGIRVIVAGLDMDYRARPFGQMPYLLAKADYITKLHAICVKCGNIANYSYRKETAGGLAAGGQASGGQASGGQVSGGQVLLGEKDLYEPRCRRCYHSKI
jgi:thymidine kinase